MSAPTKRKKKTKRKVPNRVPPAPDDVSPGVLRILQIFGRLSVVAEALAEADRFERMSDGELLAYGYSLANFRRDIGVVLEAATVEAERRLQENPMRFSSRELKL